MSWSIAFIGTSEKILVALKEYSQKLSGASKEEYDKVAPNLQALVQQNFNNQPDVQNNTQPVIHLQASGHAYTDEKGTPRYGSCTVSLQMLGGILV